MTISVCPIATVEAPLGVAWRVLTDSESYGDWWNARLERVEPSGAAREGQIVHASTRAIGRAWPVTVRVLGVDHDRHVLDLQTALPLGITVRNHIVVAALGPSRCRLTFG